MIQKKATFNYVSTNTFITTRQPPIMTIKYLQIQEDIMSQKMNDAKKNNF